MFHFCMPKILYIYMLFRKDIQIRYQAQGCFCFSSLLCLRLTMKWLQNLLTEQLGILLYYYPMVLHYQSKNNSKQPVFTKSHPKTIYIKNHSREILWQNFHSAGKPGCCNFNIYSLRIHLFYGKLSKKLKSQS